MFDIEDAYRKWFPIVRAKCARMTRSDALAEDLAQETFTRLWAARASLARPEVTLTWIYKTATRLAIDRHRRDRYLIADGPGRGDDDGREPTAGRPDRISEARALLAVVARVVPDGELEALVLHRVDGLTQTEIATVLGASERTVRRLLERAQERLDRIEGRAK